MAILGVEGHAKMAPADRAAIMRDLGLSDSLPVQYARWMRDIATGQLGKSFFRGDTVRDLILHRGPLSAEIAVLALIISWLVGLPVGILSAIRPTAGPTRWCARSRFCSSPVPGFWLGLLIVLALLFWFGYKAPIIIVQIWENPWENFQIVIGPGAGARAGPGRLHRAHVPVLPAGGHPRGLRAHRAGQGRCRSAPW